MADVVRGRFGDIIDGPNGPSLWAFLNRADNIVRMETATALECVAVEPLGPFLLREFGEVVRGDRFKQATGFLAKQVLESRGFRIYRSNCRITRSNLFTSGTRYVENESGASSRFEIQAGDIKSVANSR